MFLGDVVGTVVAPVQHPFYDGRTLLLIRPVAPNGKETGETRVAVDMAQAGVGDRVLVNDEGNGGRDVTDSVPDGPVKTIVVGVVDSVEVGDANVYDATGRTAPTTPIQASLA
jgi:microcompartment protein CcmK/EutM